VAFERIKYFVYSSIRQHYVYQFCNIIMTSVNSLRQLGSSVTTMPGDPVDQLIGLMLYYKLNAIMEDRIIVDETEISSMLGENMIYLAQRQRTHRHR
jgi:hypothetical protein